MGAGVAGLDTAKHEAVVSGRGAGLETELGSLRFKLRLAPMHVGGRLR